MTVPILFLTYNRLEYTKKSLTALSNVRGAEIFIIDNASTDQTVEWLKSNPIEFRRFRTVYNKTNFGIAGAMNQFLDMTKHYEFVGKSDNDTILPPDFIEKMLLYLKHADAIQAKHPITTETHPGGWNGFTHGMHKANGLYYHHFIGGSGILFKRKLVNRIPVTDWKLGGWRQFQRENPGLVKAFVQSVEIELLDADGYESYPKYYSETGRLKYGDKGFVNFMDKMETDL